MNTADLKIDIINRITKLKETRIIEEIQKLLDFELDQGTFQLNKAQKERILKANQDNILTEEQVNKDISILLKSI
ncbi:hypothetical protein [Elizabethkingia meningoseptica]|uniref:hypothetical protein n=1 Tax=Elizabethkingia meningoseptica TaxID=238 RepID=UPI00389293A6